MPTASSAPPLRGSLHGSIPAPLRLGARRCCRLSAKGLGSTQDGQAQGDRQAQLAGWADDGDAASGHAAGRGHMTRSPVYCAAIGNVSSRVSHGPGAAGPAGRTDAGTPRGALQAVRDRCSAIPFWSPRTRRPDPRRGPGGCSGSGRGRRRCACRRGRARRGRGGGGRA